MGAYNLQTLMTCNIALRLTQVLEGDHVRLGGSMTAVRSAYRNC